MLATVTSTAPQASDLSHLLRKHPDRAQSFDLSVGTAHVFYPEVSDERCTVALLLEVDAIGLVRDKRFRGSDDGSLARYVNDRPYASSSMVAVALGQVFRTAMGGKSETLPELAAAPLPLEITVAALPARGSDRAGLVTRLFAPLGWRVTETPIPLDPAFPQWGDSPYVDLVLTGEVRLSEALRHLYVLLPVLDDSKHYWVSDDEVGKLLRAGEGWLPDHPERDLITRRYLAHQRSLVNDAADRLDATARLLDTADEGAGSGETPLDETASRPRPLAPQRAEAVLQALSDVGAHTVADVGCGEGALLTRLAADPAITSLIGTDVSARVLAKAERRLNLREASDRQRDRIRLVQSSVTYTDDRLAGLDAIVLMEVIEHVDPERLPALEASVFATAAPGSVVVTTPNGDYNALFESLPAGAFRHPDHRFEWSRAEFAAWASGVAERTGYVVEYRTVGDVDPALGSPTQLALFRKIAR
ncbi:3' terminal RNA ribose 2'-O-methyltransferase Hen1 [Frondihabitans sucicola]|uniref:Small RNA 2'-O-methyltransferase n=1 Tax=Frondihabitans sucicola TaxID=1268041 RepID=A0ABM8GHD2_9MICO|nr:3' terminal RNA ribose 2'-O-methyltransferase Hen1 [Frondihabitans sucicola]BDZ47769.1 3' terminal RNA ribose 2'-O-methyltransferase Hen1 [Frondihabitans sucicola]BDZ52243.1 3' terminal RNA ribose 2'-O-methyltransferase Hen1 [Frondihabitans sucicola]